MTLRIFPQTARLGLPVTDETDDEGDETVYYPSLVWDEERGQTHLIDLASLVPVETLRARAETSQSVVNNAGLTDDFEMGLGIDTPGVYHGKAFVPYQAGTSGDFKFGWTLPADDSVMRWSYRAIRHDASAATDFAQSYTMIAWHQQQTGNATTTVGRAGGTGISGNVGYENAGTWVEIEFDLKVVTPGTLRFKIAQFGANATPTVRLPGAYLEAVPLGDINKPRNGNQYTLNGETYKVQTPGKEYSLALTRSPVYTRHELRSGDQWYADAAKGKGVERCEMSGTRYWPVNATDLWMAYSFRITGTPPTDAQGFFLISQMIQTPADAGEKKVPHCFTTYAYADPAVSGNVLFTVDTRGDAEFITTELYAPDIRCEESIATGVWHNVVVRLRMGYNDDGELDVWLNGSQVVNVTGAVIGYNDLRGARHKFGSYRNAWAETTVIEWANNEIGNTDLSARIATPLAPPA